MTDWRDRATYWVFKFSERYRMPPTTAGLSEFAIFHWGMWTELGCEMEWA